MTLSDAIKSAMSTLGVKQDGATEYRLYFSCKKVRELCKLTKDEHLKYLEDNFVLHLRQVPDDGTNYFMECVYYDSDVSDWEIQDVAGYVSDDSDVSDDS